MNTKFKEVKIEPTTLRAPVRRRPLPGWLITVLIVIISLSIGVFVSFLAMTGKTSWPALIVGTISLIGLCWGAYTNYNPEISDIEYCYLPWNIHSPTRRENND